MVQSGPETRYMALNEFRREVAILKACRDPNIVAFLVSDGVGCGLGPM